MERPQKTEAAERTRRIVQRGQACGPYRTIEQRRFTQPPRRQALEVREDVCRLIGAPAPQHLVICRDEQIDAGFLPQPLMRVGVLARGDDQ